MLVLAEAPQAEADAQRHHPIAVRALVAPLAPFEAAAAAAGESFNGQGQHPQHVEHDLVTPNSRPSLERSLSSPS